MEDETKEKKKLYQKLLNNKNAEDLKNCKIMNKEVRNLGTKNKNLTREEACKYIDESVGITSKFVKYGTENAKV